MIEITYFGTSDHSVILLDSLKQSKKVDIKLVITKPDSRAGRKMVSNPSPVKTWCVKNDVPFITSPSLKNDLDFVINSLEAHPTEIGLVADYGLIIPLEAINAFKKGVVNIHFSLLPKYRGASPVTYTILNGDKTTGITYLFTTKEMDKGDILFQYAFEITEKENDETLYQKLFKLAREKTPEVLTLYSNGEIKPTQQDESKATYTTPSGMFDRTTLVRKEDAKIDFSKSPEYLERFIRAFFPWPVAWTTLSELSDFLKARPRKNRDLKVKIRKAHVEDKQLILDEVLPESSKTLSFADFKNGYLFYPTAPGKAPQ